VEFCHLDPPLEPPKEVGHHARVKHYVNFAHKAEPEALEQGYCTINKGRFGFEITEIFEDF
jgi:hypothetical protein